MEDCFTYLSITILAFAPAEFWTNMEPCPGLPGRKVFWFLLFYDHFPFHYHHCNHHYHQDNTWTCDSHLKCFSLSVEKREVITRACWGLIKMNKVMMMNLLLMKMISTYSFIEGESQVEFFEMVSVDEKPHAVHPSKLLLRHKHNVHLAKKFQIRAGKCDYCNDVHMLKIWTNIIGLFI